MIKKTKTIKEIIIKNKYCDICEEKIISDLACSKANCSICKKDLCEKCIEHENDTWGRL